MLREIWLNIGMEKIDMYEDIIVKVLLDSGTTGMFIDKRIAAKHGFCKKAKLQAGIKPTALCSVINKENSIEFLLDFLYYLYNYYMVCALSSHAYHVTSCDINVM